jgi:adenylate cyclase
MLEQKEKFFRLAVNKIIVCVILSLVILFLTQETFFKFTPLKRIELASIDTRFNIRGKVPFDPKVIIAEISEESFKHVPDKWPWPRSYYAHLIRNLKRAGALAIGIDVIMGSPDSRNTANDDEFRKALGEVKIAALAGKVEIPDERYNWTSANENYGNIFFDVDSSLGIVFLRNDDDGVFRRYHPFVVDRARQLRIPTFSFAVLNKAFNRANLSSPDIEAGNINFQNIKIPTYDGYSSLINFYGPSNTFKRYKFVDIIDDKD